ncbi:interleukin-18 receptor 1-like [Pelobates fuscus]|uniref:interleukin-18 receptor 1-like n=1 Tax=Pelobates fuscus TaxID=191477 RepID=UPI002FE4C3F5
MISFDSIQQSDAGEYAFVITRTHNGLSYSSSRRTKLVVKDEGEIVRPTITGEKNVTAVIELGEDFTVKCEAFYGHSNNTDAILYWLQANKNYRLNSDEEEFVFVDTCGSVINTTCSTETSEMYKNNKVFGTTELHLRSIDKDDIKYPFKCQLVSNSVLDIKSVTLTVKDRSKDISHHFFRTFLAASITCSVCIVSLVILCIIFRIEMVLLYRSVTRKDDTIGDGKEYDAYLSFANHSLADHKEKEFAFKTLPNIIENYFGYKLCIFERDIIPGGATVDDINSYLEKCRRLIILLSKNCMSDKSIYELESGMHKAMVERKIKVIVIEFTPLNELNVMPESLQLLKTSSRVRWEECKTHSLTSRFWKKIRYLMPAKPVAPNISFSNAKKSSLSYIVNNNNIAY